MVFRIGIFKIGSIEVHEGVMIFFGSQACGGSRQALTLVQ
jgi:hypothetical protein